MTTASREFVQQSYSKDARTYDRIRLEEARGALLSQHDLDIFESMIPASTPGGLVLEAGAGTGRFTLSALDRGHRVIATDINPTMLELLREKVQQAGKGDQCTIQPEDIFHLSFPDAHFTMAYSLHVIPRFITLEDQRAAIIEVARTLKPGAKFLFNYRNSSSFYAMLYRGHAASPAQMQAIFDECGLKVVQTRGKWLLNKKVLSRLPVFVGRMIAAADRALRGFWPAHAWDVFVLTEKRAS